MQPVRPKCFFVALVLAWVVAIYVPSAAIAAAGLSPLAEGRNFAAAVWAVADEVAPAAKIGFAVLLGFLLFVRRRLGSSLALPADIVLASASMLLIVALLPRAWSRGFGVGLAGIRFDPAPLAIYLAAAAFAGLVFHFSETRCLRRNYPSTP